MSSPLGRILREKIDPVDSENDNGSIDWDFASNVFIFPIVSMSTPLGRILRGNIDPVDSKNDDESID